MGQKSNQLNRIRLERISWSLFDFCHVMLSFSFFTRPTIFS